MQYATHLLLASTLAIGPWGCSRDKMAPEDTVSANSDRTQQSESIQPTDRTERTDRPAQPAQPAPNKNLRGPVARDRTTRETTTENRRVDRDQDRVESRTESRTDRDRVESRNDEDRTLDRTEDRARNDAVTPQPRATTAAKVSVPSGTAFSVVLLDPISTDTNQEGDTFTATLYAPMVVDGKVVAEKGDRVKGTIKNVEEAGKVKGRARLELVLNEITVKNRNYRVSTEPFIAVAEDSKDRDAGLIAGGAGVGAAIGAIAGGKKGAALGAIIGGGSGTTAVLMTKGKPIKLDPETKVNFVLSDDVSLPVIRSSNT
jgi:hypothetical protein